ncbi:MAG: hypothetical protein Q4C77_04195 [Eubacteriales bacterium]|nr:hypothetical protein [Eubacteriales bacterium]
MEDFKKELNFESDTFSNVKRDMNFVLQRLLGNMQEKGATEGSMTLKIDVSFDTAYIPNYDPNIEGESRRIEKPKFVHKVTSAVQIKDEKKGNMDTEMELVFDEDSGEYVMKPIANTEQRTIFDDDFQDNIQGSGRSSEDQAEEESPTGIPQLPGPTDEEIIDGEYTEVEREGEPQDGIPAPENPEAEEESPDEEFEDMTDELLDGAGNEEEGEEPDDYDYEDPEDE